MVSNREHTMETMLSRGLVAAAKSGSKETLYFILDVPQQVKLDSDYILQMVDKLRAGLDQAYEKPNITTIDALVTSASGLIESEPSLRSLGQYLKDKLM